MPFLFPRRYSGSVKQGTPEDVDPPQRQMWSLNSSPGFAEIFSSPENEVPVTHPGKTIMIPVCRGLPHPIPAVFTLFRVREHNVFFIGFTIYVFLFFRHHLHDRRKNEWDDKGTGYDIRTGPRIILIC